MIIRQMGRVWAVLLWRKEANQERRTIVATFSTRAAALRFVAGQ